MHDRVGRNEREQYEIDEEEDKDTSRSSERLREQTKERLKKALIGGSKED